MTTKMELLKELFVENGLSKEDVHELNFSSGKKVIIIKREGIEKIQFHNNIKVNYYVESIVPPDFVVIKAIAKKDDVVMESYGEASSSNNKQAYPVAMAEKRALSRVILKITGFYKYSVMGEDEADEFKEKAA